MSRIDRVVAALEALPPERQDEIAEIVETLFHGDLHHETALSPEQLADLAERVRNPGRLATEEEVQAFFARFAE